MRDAILWQLLTTHARQHFDLLLYAFAIPHPPHDIANNFVPDNDDLMWEADTVSKCAWMRAGAGADTARDLLLTVIIEF